MFHITVNVIRFLFDTVELVRRDDGGWFGICFRNPNNRLLECVDWGWEKVSGRRFMPCPVVIPSWCLKVEKRANIRAWTRLIRSGRHSKQLNGRTIASSAGEEEEEESDEVATVRRHRIQIEANVFIRNDLMQPIQTRFELYSTERRSWLCLWCYPAGHQLLRNIPPSSGRTFLTGEASLVDVAPIYCLQRCCCLHILLLNFVINFSIVLNLLPSNAAVVIGGLSTGFFIFLFFFPIYLFIYFFYFGIFFLPGLFISGTFFSRAGRGWERGEGRGGGRIV